MSAVEIMTEQAIEGAYRKAQTAFTAYSNHSISQSMLAKRVFDAFDQVMGEDADGVLAELPDYRDIAYQLYYANEIAMAVVETHATNVVGTGLTLKCNMNRDLIQARTGLDDDALDVLEEQIETDFENWSETPRYCDVDGEMSFFEHQDLALRTRMIGGDAPGLIVRRDARRAARNGYLTQLQAISPRRLSNPQNQPDTAMLRGGIERNGQGQLRFHFSRKDPNSTLFDGPSSLDWFPGISKFNAAGRQNVTFVKRMQEPGQTRGRPLLMVIAKLVARIGKFTDAQVMAAIKHAFMSLYMEGEPDSLNYGDDAPARPDGKLELKEGTIAFGSSKPHLLQSHQPGPHLEQFYTQGFKIAGMATGIPWEILCKAFTTSYSASRGARNEYKRLIRLEQKHLRIHFCKPVYCSWLMDRVMQGALDLPGFEDDEQLRNAYCRAFWIPPAEGAIDKNREIMPEIAMLQSNLKSEEMIVEELLGVPFKFVVNSIGKSRRAIEKAGIDPAIMTPNLIDVAARLAELKAEDEAEDSENELDEDVTDE